MFLIEILALTELGIFKGDGTGNFRPKDTLTRAEMAQVLTNAFELQVKGPILLMMFQQIHWAKNAISAIQQMVFQWNGENKFGPNMKVTREQYAQFLYKAILNDEQQ